MKRFKKNELPDLNKSKLEITDKFVKHSFGYEHEIFTGKSGVIGFQRYTRTVTGSGESETNEYFIEIGGKIVEKVTGSRGDLISRASGLDKQRILAGLTVQAPAGPEGGEPYKELTQEQREKAENAARLASIEAGFEEIRKHQEEVAARHAEADRLADLAKLKELQTELAAAIKKLEPPAPPAE